MFFVLNNWRICGQFVQSHSYVFVWSAHAPLTSDLVVDIRAYYKH